MPSLYNGPDKILEEKDVQFVPPIWEGCYVTIDDASFSVDFTSWDIDENELTIWVK